MCTPPLHFNLDVAPPTSELDVSCQHNVLCVGAEKWFHYSSVKLVKSNFKHIFASIIQVDEQMIQSTSVTHSLTKWGLHNHSEVPEASMCQPLVWALGIAVYEHTQCVKAKLGEFFLLTTVASSNALVNLTVYVDTCYLPLNTLLLCEGRHRCGLCQYWRRQCCLCGWLGV